LFLRETKIGEPTPLNILDMPFYHIVFFMGMNNVQLFDMPLEITFAITLSSIIVGNLYLGRCLICVNAYRSVWSLLWKKLSQIGK